MSRFEVITKYKDSKLDLIPKRQTEAAAGYDFIVAEDTVVPSILVSWIKMMSEVFSQDSFVGAITKSDLGRLVLSRQFDNQEAIQQALISALPMILDQRKLTFEQMKELTKNIGTKLTLIPTGVKAKLAENEFLQLSLRSSIPMSSYIVLANSPGIIDADYYNNESNEGHIFFQVMNLSPFDITILAGERIGQGIILDYKKAENDSEVRSKRAGGFGSTN